MSGNGSAGRGTADGVGAATGTVRRSTADQEPGLAWEQRLAAAWSRLDALPAPQFRALIDALAAELPPDSAVAAFERAGAFDSTGRPDRAVPLYRLALERGVEGVRRRRAKIQLASSLRNLGRPEEGVALLSPELDAESDELDDAVRAFLGLCLADTGREREALALALGALAPHLPRYQRSLRHYARGLNAPAAS
ncbi:tetratricopeptide repeat protein [Streptomyces sp. SID4919]|uniref:tetratricopeptide repeat protein n=1 Tax=Streptomyces TaxID=1883 RepID=UPI0009A12573|nr:MULTISPECIES: tetratricopeptide repeat protein [Streptomyces]MYY09092.1 tetratricopeptide repeat protein [Streptomyces sp. SID4919]WST70837.1 tetratricopeptide repeat protein [Streptomyces uncialis]WTE10494.1 tetratricopeptide repeat protein [Streptomyces uncialis]